MRRISVIIPTLHAPSLGAVLAALADQTAVPHEVIVVGQDRYGFTSAYPLVQLIETAQPIPPAQARNLGAAQASGEIYCFLDADCIPQPTWLAQLVACLEAGASVVVGAIAVGGERYWQRCDNIAAMAPFLATAAPGPRMQVISANLALSRALFQQMQGFDDRFRYASGEDTDLAFRLVLAGHIPQFERRAVVRHATSRDQPGPVWRHLWLYGTQWPPLVAAYPQFLGHPFWYAWYQRHPLLAWLIILVWNLKDVMKLYVAQPTLLARHWTTLPGVYWARLAWYVGQMLTLRRRV